MLKLTSECMYDEIEQSLPLVITQTDSFRSIYFPAITQLMLSFSCLTTSFFLTDCIIAVLLTYLLNKIDIVNEAFVILLFSD